MMVKRNCTARSGRRMSIILTVEVFGISLKVYISRVFGVEDCVAVGVNMISDEDEKMEE